jgi:hypothetical protein
MPKTHKQQPLDISTFIFNPNKKRIDKHKKLTTKVVLGAGPRAQKVPRWLQKKRKEGAQRQVNLQAWVCWLHARGKTNITPEEPGRLQDVYGDAPPLESPDGFLLNDDHHSSSSDDS